MLWILISLFFCLCAFREIRGSFVAPRGYDFPQPVSKTYLAIVLGLAVLFAWPTVHRWYFQCFLSVKATELATTIARRFTATPRSTRCSTLRCSPPVTPIREPVKSAS